jgi:unsaturated rhamnogalacturonyl hydrolase
MAIKATQLQGVSDGLWPSSLLATTPYPESSGTAFFVSGLAWGIHRGLLARSDFLPAVQRGWQALLRSQRSDGRLGYVQPIGSEPGNVIGPDETQLYGSGAFLQAAAGILVMVEGSAGVALLHYGCLLCPNHERDAPIGSIVAS